MWILVLHPLTYLVLAYPQSDPNSVRLTYVLPVVRVPTMWCATKMQITEDWRKMMEDDGR